MVRTFSIRSQCLKLMAEWDRNLILDGQWVFSSLCTWFHAKDSDVVMADPFSSKQNAKYNLEQKQNRGKLCLKYKLEAKAEPKKHWDPKRKKHAAPSLSFKSTCKAVREFFLLR